MLEKPRRQANVLEKPTCNRVQNEAIRVNANPKGFVFCKPARFAAHYAKKVDMIWILMGPVKSIDV